MLVLKARLDPDEGALTLAALRAAQDPAPHLGDGQDGQHEEDGQNNDETRSGPGNTPAEAPADDDSHEKPVLARKDTDGKGTAPAEASSDDGPDGEEGLTCAEPEEEETDLVDAFVAIMTSYLGSTARDSADPEAFQVIVVADAATLTTDTGTGTDPVQTPTHAAGTGDQPTEDASPGRPPTAQGSDPAETEDETKDETPAGTEARVGAGIGVRFARRAALGGIPGGVLRIGIPDSTDPGTPGGCTHDGIALPPDTILRIACDAATVHATVGDNDTPMDVGRRTRRINTLMRRALRLRDAGRCRFPGCTTRRRLHAHHVRHWAHDGETKLANLISLCPAHHWAVHEGGFQTWTDARNRLRFARPDGRLMDNSPPMGPAIGDLVTRPNSGIDADTIVPNWDGTPLDLANAVLTLLQPNLRTRRGAA